MLYLSQEKRKKGNTKMKAYEFKIERFDNCVRISWVSTTCVKFSRFYNTEKEALEAFERGGWVIA